MTASARFMVMTSASASARADLHRLFRSGLVINLMRDLAPLLNFMVHHVFEVMMLIAKLRPTGIDVDCIDWIGPVSGSTQLISPTTLF